MHPSRQDELNSQIMIKEDSMSKRKGKTASFDAMVKFFMQNYNIPTKKDVDHLIERLDRLENLIKSSMGSSNARTARRKTSLTAVDIVLDTIRRANQGIDFDEKKIRNIIFRLNKTGKIQRQSRGVYIAT
jgi:hypothetical protein